MRLIIAIQKKVGIHGHKVRGFLFSPAHKLHIWGGAEMDAAEFNVCSQKVFTDQASLHPFALAVGDAEPVAQVATDSSAVIAALEAQVAQLTVERNHLASALNPTPGVSFSAAASVEKKRGGKG